MNTAKFKISTRRYRTVHGHRPQGLGLWYFQMPGGRIFTYAGPFALARRAAAGHARDSHLGEASLIQVCA